MSDETQEATTPDRFRKLMNEDLIGVHLKCAWCENPIPDELAAKGHVTCSKECRDARTRWLRARRVDDKKCRFCHRPGTTSQRSAFRRFVQWEMEHPAEAHPRIWKVLSARGIDLGTFCAAVEEARDQDFSFEFHPAAVEWRRFPKPDTPHENLDKCIEALKTYWREREPAPATAA